MKSSQRRKYVWTLTTCAALVMVSSASAVAAPGISVLATRLETDQNTPDKTMTATFKVQGGGLAKAQSLRILLNGAVDETGQSLLLGPHDWPFTRYFDVLGKSSNKATILDLKIKSPSRQSAVISKISGELEIYSPHNDPASIITKDLQQQAGKPMVSPLLKAQGISIMLWSNEQYQQHQKEVAAKSTSATLNEAIGKSFEQMFRNYNSKSNRLIFRVEDPNERLTQISFEDAQGKELPVNGLFRMGHPGKCDQIFDFDKELPVGTRIKLYVATPKSITRVPFQLKDLQLP